MQENEQNLQDFSTKSVENALCDHSPATKATSCDEMGAEKTGTSPDSTRVLENFDTKSEQASDSESKNSQNLQKTEPCGRNLSFLDFISSNFDDFSKKFPNISKESLTDNKMLEIFAKGKENQGLVAIYNEFCVLVSQIEHETEQKIRYQAELERSSVGSLGTAGAISEPFFSKEQVKRMTQREIRENLDAIRKSQAHW